MTTCVHYWAIDPPRGPYSLGTCKHCGEHQMFKNTVGDGWPDNRVPWSKDGQGLYTSYARLQWKKNMYEDNLDE